MNKRILFLIGLLSLWASTINAQNPKSEINGKIISGEEAAGFAAVGLKGTSYGVTADEQGTFSLKNIPTGNYELVVSAIGFKPFKKAVSVGAEKVWLTIPLVKTQQQLQEVVISGTMKETYTMQSPIHVEVYTPKLFQKNPTPSIFEAMQMRSEEHTSELQSQSNLVCRLLLEKKKKKKKTK